MKSVAILALAAGASATWKGANPFTCPQDTDNKCDDKQKPGFNWGDLTPGKFDNYNNFGWKGWTCEDDQNQKRDRYDRRTFGKVIKGSCGAKKEESPSFGCGNQFSLDRFHLSVEFDVDLEFHYDMPDGSTCRHRNSCKKGGSVIKNNQCGGAKNVTIVYPPQVNKPKPSCGVTMTSIDFDCSTRTKTTKTKSVKTKTTPPAVSTTKETSKTKDVPTTSATKPAESIPSSTVVSSTSAVESSSSVTSVVTTSYLSTSTVYTTSVSTIISCAEDVPSCPGKSSVVVVTQTVPVSTTICPVTETSTVTKPQEQPSKSKDQPQPPVSTSATKDQEQPSSSVESSATKPILSSTSSQQPPVETAPCPDVVPSCLNTFLFLVEKCKDNTDAACYCPEKDFVEKVFNCIYAHGDDAIVQEAVQFFQGICAKHVPSNPAIITAPTCTDYVSVTKTPVPATTPVVTLTVSETVTVPCTDEAGSTIPSSSTVKTIDTTITVPQVDFTPAPPAPTGGAGNDDEEDDDVVLIPGTTGPAVEVPVPTGAASTAPVQQPATKTSAGYTAPTGTGAVRPSGTTPATINAGGRTQVGFAGLAGVAVMAVAALL